MSAFARAALLGAFLTSGCGLGVEGNFTGGRTIERCDGTFPICQTTAGCVMSSSRYLEGSFPGQRQVIVSAPAESIIQVDILFRTQEATGVDTEVLWHEPGCFDTYQYLSEGRDIFLEAGNDRVFSRSQQVFLDGDHLIEVFSDAVADYLLRVDVEASSGRR